MTLALLSHAYILYTYRHTNLVMAGLEGAPGAVESHLHRGEGQIGHKILTTLRITVLHLEERAEVGKLRYPKSKYRKRSVKAQKTGQLKHLKLSVGSGWLESKSCMSNCHHRAFVDN